MKYIVITSKHHDGFAMFHSKASDWNIVEATPFGRDPLKELAAACRKAGHQARLLLLAGPGLEQSRRGGGGRPLGQGPGRQTWTTTFDKVAVPQVREILTNYGHVAVLWWDTPVDMTKRARRRCSCRLLKLQPGIITNNRLGGGFSGDTETPEQHIPATGFPGRDWETCMTMNNTWGYKSYDHNWKTTETLIRNLVDIASKGGNYLLNVGPTSEGLIPGAVRRAAEADRQVDEGQRRGDLRHDGQPVQAASLGPLHQEGRRRRHDALPARLRLAGRRQAGRAGAEERGRQRRTCCRTAKSSLWKRPAASPASLSSVPASRPGQGLLGGRGGDQGDAGRRADADWDRRPTVRSRLPAADAICHGKQIQCEGGAGHENIGFWLNPDDYIEWLFTVKKPGTFRVTAELAAPASTSIVVAAGGGKLEAKSPVTGDYKKYQKVDLGTIELAKQSKASLTVKAVKQGWRPLNVRSITLKPAK